MRPTHPSRRWICAIIGALLSSWLSVPAHTVYALDSCEQARAALKLASKLRGLPVESPVGCLSLSQEKFRTLDAKHSRELLAPGEIEAEASFYRLLGFIPASYDYKRCVIQGAGENIRAFYHIFRKAIVMPSDRPQPLSVLVHESVHALQDQHYNLSLFAPPTLRFTDEVLAASTLIEGDAMHVQQEVTDPAANPAPDEEAPQKPDVCTLPELLDAQYTFPYQAGPLYVKSISARGDYARALGAAFKNRPRATREILDTSFHYHALIPAPESTWPRGAYYDRLGTTTIELLLIRTLGEAKAGKLARGWRDDLLTQYAPRAGQISLRWVSWWDTSEQALEFLAAVASMQAKLHGAVEPLPAPAFKLQFSDGQILTGRSSGSKVEILIEAPSAVNPKN